MTYAQVVSREIAVDEMVRMRVEEKLSNSEIAERCGLCLATVTKHIGKQPKECRKNAKGKDQKVTVISPPEVPEVPANPFVPMPKQSIQYRGEFAKYTVNLVDKTLEIRGDTVELSLTIQQAIKFIEEVERVIQSAETDK